MVAILFQKFLRKFLLIYVSLKTYMKSRLNGLYYHFSDVISINTFFQIGICLELFLNVTLYLFGLSYKHIYIGKCVITSWQYAIVMVYNRPIVCVPQGLGSYLYAHLVSCMEVLYKTISLFFPSCFPGIRELSRFSDIVHIFTAEFSSYCSSVCVSILFPVPF